MNFPRYSLRTTVIVLLSFLSMMLVLLAWEVFRDYALKSQESALQEALARVVKSSMYDVEESAEEVGMTIQSLPAFRQAFSRKNQAEMMAVIDNQFQRYDVTAGNINIVQIYAYDKNMELLAWSNEGPRPNSKSGVMCSSLAADAGRRKGLEQLKVFAGQCHWQRRIYLTVIVPIGGLNHLGYLQVVADPLNSLFDIERFLELPIKIESHNNEVIYRSPAWQPNLGKHEGVVAAHWLLSNSGEKMMQLFVQRDLHGFVDVSINARNKLLLFAGLVTVVVVIIALFALEKTTVRPIQKLIEQLNRVRQDRRYLEVPLDVGGNVELRKLSKVFSEMGAELARLYDKYEELAFTDPLTLLPNRALFLDRLKQLILISKRKTEKFGIMLIDLDGFKDINDTLGHHVGDELLRQIGERLRNVVRSSSTVARVADEQHPLDYVAVKPETEETTIARLGGDEFAILLPNLKGVEGAISVAKRVAQALEPPAELDGNSVVIAGTIGIALFPDHGEDGETLLRRADVALYVAKHLQNDFSVYDSAYDHHSVNQLALKAELRTAIEENQLVLYYQPKLNFKSDCITSVEALVRWAHPERGLIPPDQFIPLSEHRGLIGALTEWVVKEALRQCAVWQQQGIYLQVAVNLSSRVLYDLSLPSKIEQYLVKAKLPPSVLSLEITEEATMLEPKRAMEILNRLDQMGVSLSIDDFGTGYSSLGYLKRLPVDEIKIDRSFVMEMENAENDAKIVHATIDLAHNLGLKVVAEGVETEVALKMLKALNCDYAQGFYLSRPVPPKELEQWLIDSGWACEI